MIFANWQRIMVLAQLAVDHRAQDIKLGASLLQDAVNRAVAVSHNAEVRAATTRNPDFLLNCSTRRVPGNGQVVSRCF